MWTKILQSIQKLLKRNSFGTGALLNPFDPRDIKYSEVVKIATAVPPEPYESDVSFLEVNNQGDKGTCVGQAHTKVVEALQYLDIGQTDRLSARDHYVLCKKVDGNNNQGTYPVVSAQILKDTGVTLAKDIPDDNSLAYEVYMLPKTTVNTPDLRKANRIGGYAFVNPLAVTELLQAIKKQKYVPATIAFGNWDYFGGRAQPDITLKLGLHRVFFYGYDWETGTGKLIIKFFNSWGKNFGKNGRGWFYYEDYVTAQGCFIFDVMTFIDIPQKVLDKKDTKLQTYITEDKNFSKAVLVILENEGGYSNDPNDPGGETKYGISKRAYPTEDIKNLTVEKAKMIYRRDYWDAMKCGDMPYSVALQVFDFGVNAGTDISAKTLQKLVGVAQDGKIGKITLGAVKAQNEAVLSQKIGVARILYYSNLAKWGIYANSWVTRTLKCLCTTK